MISSQDLICQHHVTTILSVLRPCGRRRHVPHNDSYQESSAIICYAIEAVEQTSHLGSFITYSNKYRLKRKEKKKKSRVDILSNEFFCLLRSVVGSVFL